MNSTNSPDTNPLSEQSHQTEDGHSPPESFWIKQESEREAAEAAQQEALKRQEREHLNAQTAKALDSMQAAGVKAAELIHSTDDEQAARYALRVWFKESTGDNLSDKIAGQILRKAREDESVINELEPISSGEFIEVKAPEWLFKGVFRRGVSNALIAGPKVGKSALLIGLAGAMARGDEEFLGLRLDPRMTGEGCPNWYVYGPDAPIEDWLYLLKREGLWIGEEVDRVWRGTIQAPIKKIWSLGCDCGLTRPHIEELVAIAKADPGCVIALDSYGRLCGPGVDENLSTFGDRAHDLVHAFADVDATVICIHHANKSNSGGTGISAGSGHQSFSRPFSCVGFMNWLTPVAEGQTRTDKRLQISQMGRMDSSSVVAEITDNGWVCHGNGDELQQEQHVAEQINKLGEGPMANTYDFVMGWSERGTGCTRGDIAAHLNKTMQQVSRYVNQLKSKGLLREEYAVGGTTSKGGRPSGYLYCTYVEKLQESSSEPSKTVGSVENIVINVEKPISDGTNLEVSLRSSPFITGSGTERPIFSKDDWLGQPVEILSDGEWHNGWKCSNANPHDIHAWRIGSSGQAVKRKGLRAFEDVRLCQATPVEEDDYEI